MSKRINKMNKENENNKHIEWWDSLPKWKKQKLAEDEYWISYKDIQNWQIKKLYLNTNNY